MDRVLARRSLGRAGVLGWFTLLLPLTSHAQSGVQYVFDAGWPAQTTGYRRQEVTGVDTDAQGRVYFCRPSRPSVLVFDREGHLLQGWKTAVLGEPHSVRIDPQGSVWIPDKEYHQVWKFTPDGAVIQSWGVRKRRGNDTTRFDGPADVAFGKNGDVYIADGYGNSRIVRLSADGQYLGQWGTHGSGPGQFRLPHSIATDPDGLVYVADRWNRRIQVFTPEGQFVRMWSVDVDPSGLDITPERKVFLASEDPESVTVYDTQGNLLGGWRNPEPPPPSNGRRRRKPQRTRLPGELAQPHMLCVDDRKAVYTAELRGHRVQKWEAK